MFSYDLQIKHKVITEFLTRETEFAAVSHHNESPGTFIEIFVFTRDILHIPTAKHTALFLTASDIYILNEFNAKPFSRFH